MANATVTVTRTNSTTMGNLFVMYGTIAISGGTDVYVVGGLPLNFTPLAKASRIPVWVEIQGQNGYEYAYINGSNASNGKIKISTTAVTELTGVAVPAGVSGDVISYRAEFKGML